MNQVEETSLALATPQVAMAPAGDAQPAGIWRSKVWPAVGAALLWTGSELLPELLAAWQASAASKSGQAPVDGGSLWQGDSSGRDCPAPGRERGRRHRRGRRDAGSD